MALSVLVPAVLVALVAWPTDEPVGPVAIRSDGAVFDTVDELVAAADLVVLAEVVDAGPGRTVGTGDDGIVTRFVELQVVEAVVGEASGVVVLEEPATLLDGTPIVVDDVAPTEVGRRGVFFLVRDDTATFTALVGEQGRFLVVDGADELEPSGDDALSRAVAGDGGPALLAAVVAAGGG